MAQLETFLEVLLVEELPVEDAQATGVANIVTTEKGSQRSFLGRVVACDKQFPRGGMMVDMPYKVGDIVFTNEFGRDKLMRDPFRDWAPIKPNDKQYYTIRYEDIYGRVSSAS